MYEIKVYRYNKNKEYKDIFKLSSAKAGHTVLDSLLYIKNYLDSSLSFRKSCREGVCGSCSMNINGINRLACQTKVESLGTKIIIYPLPHLYIIRDLVVDLEPVYKQLYEVDPWLKPKKKKSKREFIQSKKEVNKLNNSFSCILQQFPQVFFYFEGSKPNCPRMITKFFFYNSLKPFIHAIKIFSGNCCVYYVFAVLQHALAIGGV